MKIIMKGVPPSLNETAGRAAAWQYRAEKANWTKGVYYKAKAEGVPPAPYDKSRVTITYYFKTAGRRDPDNYCGKYLLDGLTKAGVIADDSFQHIELFIRGSVDKKNPRTEILIEPV